ncbi:MAG: PaaI family thioesterase [Deltaproteobacteria bacterium]
MPTPTQEALDQYAALCNAHPSLRSFGVKVHFPDLMRLRLRVESVPLTMRGGLGDATVVNGGVLSALCDVLIGCTCGLVDPASRSATVQLAIRFERPLRGDLIQGEARVDRATKRLVFASAEISDASGEVCVRCQGLASLIGGRG